MTGVETERTLEETLELAGLFSLPSYAEAGGREGGGTAARISQL